MRDPLPLILFGAFDRHNLGDLLFAHIAACQARRPVIFAGLAARDLTPWGGHRVRAIAEVAEAWRNAPADFLHVGGETLTCTRFEAAVMLQSPEEATTAIRRYEHNPAEGDRWARQILNGSQQLAYVVPRSLFRNPGRFVFHGIGGVDLDRLPAPLRAEALAVLRAADRVCVRDATTRAHLTAAGILADLAPDPAALIVRFFFDEIARHAGQGEVAELRARYPGGYLAVQFSADFGDDATLEELAARLLEVRKESGLAVVLFCAGLAPWHDDPAVYRRLLARLPPGIPATILQSAHIWDVCALLAHATAYCGSSLHGRIVATAFARPAVSLLRGMSAPTKQAAYAATWDVESDFALATPEGLANAVSLALNRNPAERAAVAESLANRADSALKSALEAAA